MNNYLFRYFVCLTFCRPLPPQSASIRVVVDPNLAPQAPPQKRHAKKNIYFLKESNAKTNCQAGPGRVLGEMPAGASKGWLAFSRSAPMKPKWVPQWFHQGVYFLSLGWAWEPHLGTGRGQSQTSTHKKNVVLLRKTLVFYWPASFQGLLEGSPMRDQTNQIWDQVLDPKWPNKVQNGRSSKTHQKN